MKFKDSIIIHGSCRLFCFERNLFFACIYFKKNVLLLLLSFFTEIYHNFLQIHFFFGIEFATTTSRQRSIIWLYQQELHQDFLVYYNYLHNTYTYFNDISFSIWFSLKVNSFQWSVLMDVLHIAEFSVPKCEIFCRWISYKLFANFQIFSDTSCENIIVFLTETLSVCVYCVSYYSHALLKVLILKPPLKLPCRT